MSSVMADLILDVRRMTVDEHGVRGFVWPLGRHEVVAVRDAIPPLVVEAARGERSSDEEAELLSIVFGGFVNEVLGLYQAHALNRRLRALGYRPMAPPGTRYLAAVASEAPPWPSPFLESLERGVLRDSRGVRAMLSRMRTDLRWNGPSPAIARPYDRERDIGAIQRLPLIHRRARVVPEAVRFRDRGQWFGPLDGWATQRSQQATWGGVVVEKALKAAHVGFAAGNEELPGYLDGYLRDWLVQAMGLSHLRLAHMLDLPEGLPRHLWTGNGGSVWNRILRHATRRLGGTVTGHDHGNGTGHLVSILPTLMEFESCDTFVTFTPTQAECLQKGLRPDLLIPPNAPKIIAAPLPRDGSSAAKRVHPRRPRSRGNGIAPAIRTVMYPSSFYHGDGPNYTVLIPDMVALDWEARLFSHLSHWGYRILHKPHPYSVALPPAGFAQAFGGTTLLDRFESVMHLADAFVFVSPQSTTFVAMLESGKPMVFVDPGLFEWVPKAYEMLRRRCRIVRGWFDDANRLQVDWDELRGAIQESGDLKDTAFLDSYYGPRD